MSTLHIFKILLRFTRNGLIWQNGRLKGTRKDIFALFSRGCLLIGPKVQKLTCISQILVLVRVISAQLSFQSVCSNSIFRGLVESWTRRVSEVVNIPLVVTLALRKFEVVHQTTFMQCKKSIWKITSQCQNLYKEFTLSALVLINGNRWGCYIWNLAASWYH